MKNLKFDTNITMITKDRYTREILQKEESHNIVVNTGLNLAIHRIFDTGYNLPNVIAIGEGTTSEVAGDTTLESEVTRLEATVTFPANNQVQLEKEFTFGSGESYNITEVGIFDQLGVSGSTMFNRAVQSVKAVDSDISLIVTITVTANDL